MTITNVVNGVEIECREAEDGKPAQVIIRNPKGKREAVVEIYSGHPTLDSSTVKFCQVFPVNRSEIHAFQPLLDQQFCGAKLSDGYTCGLPPRHKIHAVQAAESCCGKGPYSE